MQLDAKIKVAGCKAIPHTLSTALSWKHYSALINGFCTLHRGCHVDFRELISNTVDCSRWCADMASEYMQLGVAARMMNWKYSAYKLLHSWKFAGPSDLRLLCSTLIASPDTTHNNDFHHYSLLYLLGRLLPGGHPVTALRSPLTAGCSDQVRCLRLQDTLNC
jgi:hypothetical protein